MISAAAYGIREDWRPLELLEVLAAWCALRSFKSRAYVLYMSFQSVHDGSDVLSGNSRPLQLEFGIHGSLHVCGPVWSPIEDFALSTLLQP